MLCAAPGVERLVCRCTTTALSTPATTSTLLVPGRSGSKGGGYHRLRAAWCVELEVTPVLPSQLEEALPVPIDWTTYLATE